MIMKDCLIFIPYLWTKSCRPCIKQIPTFAIFIRFQLQIGIIPILVRIKIPNTKDFILSVIKQFCLLVCTTIKELNNLTHRFIFHTIRAKLPNQFI